MTKIYLAYGSNLNLEQMYNRCPGAEFLGTSALVGWRATFRGNYRGVGVMDIQRSHRSEVVPVALFSITKADELALDRYEGYPRLYVKKYVDVELNGKIVNAMVYVMNDGFVETMPSDSYYDTIRQGYIDCGFDISYLQRTLLRLMANIRKTRKR